MRKFWEGEEYISCRPALSIEEKTVQEHFNTAHTKDELSRKIIPLPRRENMTSLGDSQALVMKRFLSLECLLRASDRSHAFA